MLFSSITALRKSCELRCGSKFSESFTRHIGRLPSRKGASFPQFDAWLKRSSFCCRRDEIQTTRGGPHDARHRSRYSVSSGSRNRHRRRLFIRPACGAILACPPILRSNRGIITSVLVGVAGAFVGYHIAVLLAPGGEIVTTVLPRRWVPPWCCSAGGWPNNNLVLPEWLRMPGAAATMPIALNVPPQKYATRRGCP